jgi:hypothetical protein
LTRGQVVQYKEQEDLVSSQYRKSSSLKKTAGKLLTEVSPKAHKLSG